MKLKRVLGILLILVMVCSMANFTCLAEDANKLVAHYKFDGDFKDSSGNSLDGQLTGDVPFQQGILGQCAQFGNGYIEVKDNDLLDFSTSFSASMWVKMSPNVDKANWSGLKTLIIKRGAKATSYGISLYHSRSCHAEFSGDNANVSYPNAVKDMTLIGDKWYLLTVTLADGKACIYYDDKFMKSFTLKDEDKVLGKSDKSLYIGQDVEGAFTREYYGMIDDLKIYNYALSPDEIKTMYADTVKSTSGVIELQIGNPKMTVNSKEQEVDPGRNTAPIIIGNSTMVPIGAIVEAMGGTIGWNGKESRVDITVKEKTIKLWIGKKESLVGTEKKALDVAPTIVKGRTMLPLKFVTENLGAMLEWDNAAKKITIRYNP